VLFDEGINSFGTPERFFISEFIWFLVLKRIIGIRLKLKAGNANIEKYKEFYSVYEIFACFLSGDL